MSAFLFARISDGYRLGLFQLIFVPHLLLVC